MYRDVNYVIYIYVFFLSQAQQPFPIPFLHLSNVEKQVATWHRITFTFYAFFSAAWKNAVRFFSHNKQKLLLEQYLVPCTHVAVLPSAHVIVIVLGAGDDLGFGVGLDLGGKII